LALVDRAAAEERDPTARRDLEAGVARHRAMLRLAYGDVGEAVRLAREAVERRPEGLSERAVDSYFLAVCLFWTAATGETETRLREFIDVTPPGEQDVRRVFAIALLAEIHALRGELDEAERLVQASLETIEARGLDEHPPTEQTHTAAAIILLARGAVERAEERLEHSTTLARRGHDRIEIAHALLWPRPRPRG
jgi:hypothetical protein